MSAAVGQKRKRQEVAGLHSQPLEVDPEVDVKRDIYAEGDSGNSNSDSDSDSSSDSDHDGSSSDSDSESDAGQASAPKVLKFRNYRPQHKQLQDKHLLVLPNSSAAAEPVPEAGPIIKKLRTATATGDWVEQQVGHLLPGAKKSRKQKSGDEKLLLRASDSEEEEENTAEGSTQDGPLAIAPKEANWDLKRDVRERLELLEKRTQRALLELSVELKTSGVPRSGTDESGSSSSSSSDDDDSSSSSSSDDDSSE